MGVSVWSRAREVARQTPSSRNRGVDFLRAASIVVVVLGHWFMAAPWVDANGTHIEHMLEHAVWTQWMTWGLQVMPVFFFVGGYANGISYSAAVRDQRPWRIWLAGRLIRLLRPALALVVFWAVADSIALAAGVSPTMVQVASQIALIPTWFLAVYVMVILIVPMAHRSWKRFGMASIGVPAAAAALLDLAYFQFDLRALGWANFFFIWGAVHQLGLAWLDDRCASGARAKYWFFGGLIALIAMTELGPWPRSLVGVPGEDFSNTTPPHIPLLALAAFQFGAVRMFETRLRNWLTGETIWTGTVLINGMIMTTFLWHSTVMILLFGLSLLVGGIGLDSYPGTSAWWIMKVVWIAAFAAVLVPVVAAASRFERVSRMPEPAAAWRQVSGALLVGVGLALLANSGGVDMGSGRLAYLFFALPFAGALIAGMLPLPGSSNARA